MELSPSGHHVAYTWNGLIDNGASIADSLRLVDLDRAVEQTFHLNAEERFIELAWSPDERYVAVNVFARSQPNHFRLDIYGMDGSRKIGVGAAYSQDVPVWSSDGRYLMFTVAEPLSLAAYDVVSGQTEWFVSNLVPSTVQGNVLVDTRSGQTDFVAVQRSAHDGAYRILYIQGKHVTPLMENLSQPPVLRRVFEGKTILVATQQPTGYALDMIDIHTRQRHTLLSGLVQVPQFKWDDENSNQTAFWWKTQTAAGLDSYNADGSRAYRLKAVLSPVDNVSGTEIFWSPDHRLALLSIQNRDGETNWQLATSDGQSVRMLGNDYKYGHAVWSSDSMNIAMEAQSSTGSNISIVDTRRSDDLHFATPVSLETMVWTECLL